MTKLRWIVGGVVCAFVVCVTAYSILGKRAWHNAILRRDSAILVGIVNDWRKTGEPQGEALGKLLSSYGSFKPFIYTNSVEAGGTNFVCIFAIQDAAFAEAGKLAVTRDRTVIWIGEKGSRIVPFHR